MSSNSIQNRDIDCLRPDFKDNLMRALALAGEADLDMLVIETCRTKERQAWLYAKGRTAPGPKRTWTLSSKHIDGIAADCVPLVDGKINWNRKDLFMQWGECVTKAGLVWGGDFRKTFDGPHCEAKPAEIGG